MKYKGQIGLLISMVILAGVIAIVMINFFSYSAVIKDDIQNISKLTSTNIYSEISNELTKPIFVSLTMANDSFVKDWLFNEKDRTDEEIIRYLNGIRSKYNYNSTFLISKESNKYFHYNGLHKIVSEKDKHDSWYFDFLNSDYIYDMDVDQDEADHNLLTLFINCKIFDDNGEVIGVTGVGLKMYYVQNLLESFEDEYDLEAFLLDENGIVQVHSTDDFILERNVFDEPLYKEFKADLLKKDSELHFFDSSGKDDSDYIIVRYIEDLNWFLIVRKDTSILRKSFMKQMGYEFLIYILLTLSVIYIVLRVISKHQMKLHDLAQTDSLTGLLNRRGFDIKLKSLINSDDMNNFSVFIFDLDGFKKVNDKYGHLQGDKILLRVIKIFKEKLPEIIFARWGGDEFAGIIYMDINDSYGILEIIRQEIENDSQLGEFNITISMGLVTYSAVETEESMIRKADNAMYTAKSEGKNRIVKYAK